MAQIKSNAKLKNLSPDDLETMWSLRHPEEEGGKVFSYTEILVELPNLFGITSSMGALSEFYAWLSLKRRIEAAAERAAQVRLELAKDSTITPDDVERVAQTVFTSETMENGDIKNFVALATLRLNKQRVDQDERRLALIEAKAKRLDDAEDAIKRIRENKDLSEEAQRAAVLDKMDEFFGLKKKN
jgi:hypothetical protein